MKTRENVKVWSNDPRMNKVWWALSWLTLAMIAFLAFSSKVPVGGIKFYF